MTLNSMQVLQNLLVFLSNLEAKLAIFKSLQPVVLEFLSLEVVIPN